MLGYGLLVEQKDYQLQLELLGEIAWILHLTADDARGGEAEIQEVVWTSAVVHGDETTW